MKILLTLFVGLFALPMAFAGTEVTYSQFSLFQKTFSFSKYAHAGNFKIVSAGLPRA